MTWARHTGPTKKCTQNIGRKYKREEVAWKTKCRWENNNKFQIELEGENWIHFVWIEINGRGS
jgi:hypothetical protein